MNDRLKQNLSGFLSKPNETKDKGHLLEPLKRGMTDRDSSILETSRRSMNDSDKKKLEPDPRHLKDTSKTSLKTKELIKTDKASNEDPLLLGKKEIPISKAKKEWLLLPKGAVIQTEVKESTIELLYDKQGVGCVEGSNIRDIAVLCNKKAINITIKKLEDKNISIEIFRNPKYSSKINVKDDKWEQQSLLFSFKALLKDLDFEVTKPAFTTQFIKTQNLKNSEDLKIDLITKTEYNPFASIHTTSTKDSKKAECINSDAMVLENKGSELEEIKEEEDSRDISNAANFKKVSENSDDSVKLTPPPSEFTSKVEKYQIEGLNWMLSREGKQPELQKEIQKLLPKENMHPLYEEWTNKNKKDNKIYLHTINSEILTHCPVTEQIFGGILADGTDDEDLGKTITTIALMVSNLWKKDSEFLRPNTHESEFDINLPAKKAKVATNTSQHSSDNSISRKGVGGTLILCSSTQEKQWKVEICKHSSLKVLVFGSDQHQNLTEYMIRDYDVIIVCKSYINSGNMGKLEVLKRIDWHRIIIDEAQYMKAPDGYYSQVVSKLKAKYRWMILRTLKNITSHGLYDMLKFLKVDPWGVYQSECEKLIAQAQSSPELLHTILRPIMLRRTKESISTEDKLELDTNIQVETVSVILQEEEEKKAYQEAKRMAKELYEKKLKAWSSNLDALNTKNSEEHFHIFRDMRRVCDHPLLLSTSKNPTKIVGEEVIPGLLGFLQRSGIHIDKKQECSKLPEIQDEHLIKYLGHQIDKLKNNEVDDCVFCLNKPEQAVFTKCGHIYCDECIWNYFYSGKSLCPTCKQNITRNDFFSFNRIDLSLFIDRIKPSSKVTAVMKSITEIAKKKEKCVCFTQWTAMMEILSFEMSKCETPIAFVKIDEACGYEEKKKLLREFFENPEKTVIIVSLMLSHVKLELTKAKHVLIIEPSWDPRIEKGAIDLV